MVNRGLLGFATYKHYRIPKSGILPDNQIRTTTGSTNPERSRILTSGKLPDPQIRESTGSPNSKIYRILWFGMWNNIYGNNNPWKKRISKSGTHECTYLYEWEMDEIWKKKPRFNVCCAAEEDAVLSKKTVPHAQMATILIF